MQSVSNNTFGPLISYLIPGATVLWGLSLFSPPLQSWFAMSPVDTPTIGGFLYLTIASLTAGMTVTALRWACIDLLHASTGLPPPRLDFSRLTGRVDGLKLLIEIHYQHYQFYANMFVATAIAYCCYRLRWGFFEHAGSLDLSFVIVEIIFFATSRDTLGKYYRRSRQLLSRR